MKYIAKALLIVTVLLSSCLPEKLKEEADKVKEQADNQFGDQNFKTAIALIELYKTREGKYPETLDSLKFTGPWDEMYISSVDYKKLDDGYELNLVRGWISVPDSLSYPREFWKGLGLKKSNMKKD